MIHIHHGAGQSGGLICLAISNIPGVFPFRDRQITAEKITMMLRVGST